ncbi:hypothetical protein [uncultured Winogradskyella sp.]|uniref:hypothetical protein n=1 Tax=uncultured Winogradskyella sp. TaxID=395353 RepID=UPI003518BF7B
MKISALLFSLFFTVCIYPQVGVGTTTPDPSAVLDITATNQGVLVPRVSLTDVADATAPVNAPATGLLVWNTNAAVTGGNGVGFYFFNGAQWVAIQQAQVDDADFFEEGTTTAPNDITDDMYTQGNIGIGQTTADYKLDITENTALRVIDINLFGNIDGERIAQNNFINGTQNPGVANSITGLYNDMDAGGGRVVFGVRNRLVGNYTSDKIGVSNLITQGTGNHYGVSNIMNGDQVGNLRIGIRNELNYSSAGNSERGIWNWLRGTSPSEKYGIWNTLAHNSDAQGYGVYNNITSGGNGNHYGTFNLLVGSGNGDKYGSWNEISQTSGGTHYGVYSNVLKSGSYAGYFLGDVSIGTNGVDNYILPDSDGTAGQIMQTDGAGNVDWVDKDSANFSLVRANLSANQVLGTGGWQKVVFNNVAFDTNTEFDIAQNRFVAANAGFYKINAGFHTSFQDNDQLYGIAVYINGSIYQESTYNHHSNGDVARSINCMVNLNAGDFVEIYVVNFQINDGTNGTNGVEIDSFTGKTYFEIQRIR